MGLLQALGLVVKAKDARRSRPRRLPGAPPSAPALHSRAVSNVSVSLAVTRECLLHVTSLVASLCRGGWPAPGVAPVPSIVGEPLPPSSPFSSSCSGRWPPVHSLARAPVSGAAAAPPAAGPAISQASPCPERRLLQRKDPPLPSDQQPPDLGLLSSSVSVFSAFLTVPWGGCPCHPPVPRSPPPYPQGPK